jgi:hypothetical protein
LELKFRCLIVIFLFKDFSDSPIRSLVTPILRRRRLEPSWDYTAEGIIWRLHPAREGMLLGEERNIDARAVSFFCVNRSGVRWKRKNFGEQWWTGIETVHNGVLFLYGFATPDLPGRKGITAVDCLTGELLWKNGDVTFIGALGGRIYSSHETPLGPVVTELDHRTGAPVREVGRGTDALQQVPRPVDDIEDVEYPQVLSEDDASPLSALVRKLSAPAVSGCPVEFGDPGPFVVIAYHRARGTARDGETTYTRVLDVVERDSGDVAMHVTLDDAVSTPAYGSFLVQADTLYFVRERKTLSAVPLHAK